MRCLVRPAHRLAVHLEYTGASTAIGGALSAAVPKGWHRTCSPEEAGSAPELPDANVTFVEAVSGIRQNVPESPVKESIMAQQRPQKVGEYERPKHTSRVSSVVIALAVLVLLIILAIIIF